MIILLFLAQTGRHKVVKGMIVNQYCMTTRYLGHPLALRKGQLDGKDVQILLDTGSEVSIARASRVDPDKWSQETVRVQCIHGHEISYPSAIVNLNLDGWERSIKVALVPNVPVDVVLRRDDPSTVTQKKSLMVTTRARERRQLQEEQMKKMLGEVEVDLAIGAALSVGQQPGLEGSSQIHYRQEPNPPQTLADDEVLQATPLQLRD